MALASEHLFIAKLRLGQAEFYRDLDQCPSWTALLDGTASAATYLDFLIKARHYVTLTYPLLSGLKNRLIELSGDEAHIAFAAQKIDEETDHDLLIDNDIARLGYDPAAVLPSGRGNWVPVYEAWIKATLASAHPNGVLGAAYALESLAVARAGKITEALRTRSTIPGITESLTFLDLHAIADVGHVEDLEWMFIGMSPADLDMIYRTTLVTRAMYVGITQDMALH